jgi:5'-methylthioadenosine phosphorylase
MAAGEKLDKEEAGMPTRPEKGGQEAQRVQGTQGSQGARQSAEIGIIGGTGVYDPQLLEDAEAVEVKTPFGEPSDRITLGMFEGRKVAILARHGSGHSIPPHGINFRANIWALKELGVKRVLATAAVGSLKEDYRAGDVVIVDQFIDWSKDVHTFHHGPKVFHVSMADPFCSELRQLLISTAKGLGIPTKERGTYLKIDGPQFSTRAASRMYRQFGDIIGMTAVPEAILCREAEICFATIATVTDYDVWADQPVSIGAIKQVMAQNLDNTKRILRSAVRNVGSERNCVCKDALKGAEA